MGARKPLLFNVPKVPPADAISAQELQSLRQAAKEAAEAIKAKVDDDRQRRQDLIENISDQSMRRSLKEK